jgi:hypothetical protein
MKPFVQKQNRAGSRWLAFIGLIAAGFGVWFYELLPELRPVPAGQLSVDSMDEVPGLTDSLDEIVDHSVETKLSGADEFDSLLNAIADDAEPLNRVLTELSEPDISVEQPIQVEPAGGSAAHSSNPVRPVSFDSPADFGIETTSGTVLEDDPTVGVTKAPPVLSAETAEVLRSVDELMRQDKIVEAHHALSTLYWKEPELRSGFLRRIEATATEIFRDPHRHFSAPYLVESGDTLESIGGTYSIPWQYLGQLNRINPRELQAGQELKVMRGPFSAVVDMERFELTIHAHGYFVHRYEVGIGEGDRTPVGEFAVQEKIKNPTWYNPEGGQIDKDDPMNPLGEYWIGLGDHIGIHGTIDPQSIGSARSRGCIHMRDADIAQVFGLLGQGSIVRIRP